MYDDSEVNMYDIELYMKKQLTSQELHTILERRWIPGDYFKYRVTMEGKGEAKIPKKFLPNWLQRFNWLAYSKLYDGAFCFPCMFFGHSTGHNSHRLDHLYTSPLTLWGSASSKFVAHQKQPMHATAVAAMEYFRTVKRGDVQPVNVLLNEKRKEIISKTAVSFFRSLNASRSAENRQ